MGGFLVSAGKIGAETIRRSWVSEWNCEAEFDSPRQIVLDTFALLDDRIMPWNPQPSQSRMGRKSGSNC